MQYENGRYNGLFIHYYDNGGKDFRGQGKDFRKAIELEPTKADFYSRLAINYDEWGKTEKAIEPYRKSAELRPHLGGHLKTGHMWSPQNRPYESGRRGLN